MDAPLANTKDLFDVVSYRIFSYRVSVFYGNQELKKLKEDLKKQLGVEPSYKQWAQTSNLEVNTLMKHKIVYEAARNKLIKVHYPNSF